MTRTKRKIRTLAITGGTGFLGSHLLRLALAEGYDVRALTRGWKPPEEDIAWVDGALDRPDSLAKLVAGADAIVHAAGAINAPTRAGFEAINVAGTAAMIDAARKAGVRRFVHISSLAAREPDLSDYGWSKARSERLVAASGLDWTIVRPPAIYGPGDRETLELFRMARRGLVEAEPLGRHVAADDLHPPVDHGVEVAGLPQAVEGVVLEDLAPGPLLDAAPLARPDEQDQLAPRRAAQQPLDQRRAQEAGAAGDGDALAVERGGDGEVRHGNVFTIW